MLVPGKGLEKSSFSINELLQRYDELEALKRTLEEIIFDAYCKRFASKYFKPGGSMKLHATSTDSTRVRFSVHVNEAFFAEIVLGNIFHLRWKNRIHFTQSDLKFVSSGILCPRLMVYKQTNLLSCAEKTGVVGHSYETTWGARKAIFSRERIGINEEVFSLREGHRRVGEMNISTKVPAAFNPVVVTGTFDDDMDPSLSVILCYVTIFQSGIG